MNWEVRTMKSGTSYFNATLLKKNLTRYWPIWALYTLIWTYALPVNCLMVQQQAWHLDSQLQRMQSFANGIPDLLEGMGPFMAFCFGILTAMAMFSYLYHTRSAGMIHSLPVRREGLFLTSYLSGLVCLLGPHALVWLLTLGAEGLCGYVDLYTISIWLAGQSAMCLFFYSFAVFCAMFTGHILALPAFYGILNFLVYVVTMLVNTLLEPFLYGFVGLPESAERAILWLTPLAQIYNEVRWYNAGLGYELQGVPELVIYAAAGLVFAAAALLVYRKRHIETAGDVVAVAVVRPIFKYGVALCSGLCFGFWLYAMFGLEALGGLTGSLLLWTFIGYFVAEMLLKKTFRVWKAWRGCAVLLVLVAVGLGGLHTDVFGFTTRVPAPATVQSVRVDGMGSYPYDTGRNFQFETEDSVLIEKVVALHRAIVNQYKDPEIAPGEEGTYIRLDVLYTLSNGTTLRRNYRVNLWDNTALARAARDFYCDEEVARLAYALDSIDPNRLGNMEVSGLWNTVDQTSEYYDFSQMIPMDTRHQALQKVYNAVLLDFEQGHLGKRYLFDQEPERLQNTCVTDLTIYWQREKESGHYAEAPVYTADEASILYSYSRSVSITLTPQAEHTIRALTELGVLNEHTSLRTYGNLVLDEYKDKGIYFDPNSFPTSSSILTDSIYTQPVPVS